MIHRVNLAIALLLAGCATGWTPSEGAVRHEDFGMEVTFPREWMHIRQGEVMLASRNGVQLERIRIHRIAEGESLPNSSKRVRAGMLPQDLAELSADSMRLTQGVTNHRVLRSDPAEVAGKDCYRMEYEYRIGAKLKMKSREYGCFVDGYLYSIEFIAPAQHYYESYLDDFEAVRASIRFTGGA